MRTLLLLSFIVLSFTASAQLTRSAIPAAADVREKVLKFYPNPAASNINFEFQKANDRGYTLQIYNFVGKKIVELTSLTPKTNILLNEFYRGVYIFQLRDRTGRIIESGKFQVAK